MIFYTVGVYNSTEAEFFDKLTKNAIEVFIDIRQRRGVRGAKYKFVNSKRLQDKLELLSVQYIHEKDLAPTKEVREVQQKIDELSVDKKRTRETLGGAFIKKYKETIVNNYDLLSFASALNNAGAKKIALFCVEEKAEACHRSIVSNELEKMGYEIRHI